MSSVASIYGTFSSKRRTMWWYAVVGEQYLRLHSERAERFVLTTSDADWRTTPVLWNCRMTITSEHGGAQLSSNWKEYVCMMIS